MQSNFPHNYFPVFIRLKVKYYLFSYRSSVSSISHDCLHPLQTESRQVITQTVQVPMDDLFENDEWEDQADKLYEWTQNLSLDELGVTSP